MANETKGNGNINGLSVTFNPSIPFFGTAGISATFYNTSFKDVTVSVFAGAGPSVEKYSLLSVSISLAPLR
jgi:hypothetical protein